MAQCFARAYRLRDGLAQLILLGSLAVESVVLMKSELKPTGSVYTKLWEVRARAD